MFLKTVSAKSFLFMGRATNSFPPICHQVKEIFDLSNNKNLTVYDFEIFHLYNVTLAFSKTINAKKPQ